MANYNAQTLSALRTMEAEHGNDHDEQILAVMFEAENYREMVATRHHACDDGENPVIGCVCDRCEYDYYVNAAFYDWLEKQAEC